MVGRQLGFLRRPIVDDGRDLGHGHFGQCLPMVRRETDDAACAICGRCTKQRVVLVRFFAVSRHQRGKVIVENEDMFVIGVVHPASAFIAGAQIAVRVMDWTDFIVWRVLLPLPWTICPVRRHQNPFVFQRIEAAVGLFTKPHRARSNQSGADPC